MSGGERNVSSGNQHAESERRLVQKAPRLLDQVRRAIRVRHYSLRTEQAYVHWIRAFILHHQKRHPTEMGPEEIQAFLSHLAVERSVAPATQNQALNALVFLWLFGEICG